MEKGEVLTIFAKCFRGIAKLASVVNDGFFVDLLNREYEEMFILYVNFLKRTGDDSDRNHVAQYLANRKLLSRTDEILRLVYILRHLSIADLPTSLLLERDLLAVRLLLISDKTGVMPLKTVQRIPRTKKHDQELRKQKFSPSLSVAHQQIAKFVASHDRVQNVDVFKEFNQIAIRTLKRKLSELLATGVIKRFAEGKKVFYLRN